MLHVITIAELSFDPMRSAHLSHRETRVIKTFDSRDESNASEIPTLVPREIASLRCGKREEGRGKGGKAGWVGKSSTKTAKELRGASPH